MQRSSLFIVFLLIGINFSIAQSNNYQYDASDENPFGRINPAAPLEVGDYALMIGECACNSYRSQDGKTWADPVAMIWRFKYIMNGMAVQDETLKTDGTHSGSIRQYNVDSSEWYVHYYSQATASSSLSVWKGNKTEEGNIILYKEQQAPNGMEGFSKLSFTEITVEGFNWLGQWVNTSETISFPFWKIECKKR